MPGAGGFLLVVMLVLALVAGGCSSDEDVKPPKPSADDSSQRAEAAQHTLDQLVRALQERSPDSAKRLAAPGASALLASVAANARSLDVRQLSLRYIDDGAPLTSTQSSEFGSRAWIGTVELQYAFGQVDTTPSRVETVVVFTPDGGGARIASFGDNDDRTPLWLADRLSVVRQGSTLVAVAGDSAGRYPRLAARAVVQVRRTLPGWHGDLVVEVPRTRAELDAALRAEPDEYDDIAAVTTTEDGSLASGAPVRVFVNPDVYDKLADRGAQVVMSHEATHVATGATFVNMPTWLLEGFADYVALNHVGVPVSLAAGQILARIRKHGLPHHLPTSADLNPTANGLGATYEEAWLACRFLGQAFGQARLIAFYYAVSGGTTEKRAFRQVLGTTEGAFVVRWRADLAHLAGVAG
jgi:hypothetical protein